MKITHHTKMMMNDIILNSTIETSQREPKNVIQQNLSRTRLAASCMFIVDGMGFGTWASVIPSFKAQFLLSDSALGGILFSMVTGALIAMPLMGKAMNKWGNHRVLPVLALIYCGSLWVLGIVPSVLLLSLAAFAFGALKGAVDVGMNAQAITVENAIKKPIMSSFQAIWSLGGLAAALFVSTALSYHIAAQTVVMSVSVILLIVTLLNSHALLPEPPHAITVQSTSRSFSPTILKVGALLFTVLFAEGAMMDWSGVYAKTISGASESLAPVAFAMFSVAMAAGRLMGDYLIARLGTLKVLRFGGFALVVGIVLVCLIHYWLITFLGFAIAGLGLANLFPILLGVGGRDHGQESGTAVATITTIGFLGLLAGPPAIGSISSFLGLPAALSIVIVFGLIISVLGTRVIASIQEKNLQEVLVE
jgi:MFS family permease